MATTTIDRAQRDNTRVRKGAAKNSLSVLRALRGLWKRHRIDPVAYQKQIRKDRNLGISHT